MLEEYRQLVRMSRDDSATDDARRQFYADLEKAVRRDFREVYQTQRDL